MKKNKVIIFGTLDTTELAHYYLSTDKKYSSILNLLFRYSKEHIKNKLV